jgi:uncharacterized protein YbjT (DUF2867 family)
MNKTAIIAGATGLIGKFCLSYLLMDKNYSKVIVITRTPLPIKDPKLENIVCDFDQLAQHASQLKGDDVYCCLGTTIAVAGSQENFKKVDLDYPINLAKITKQQGAKQFLVVSAMGASSSSSIFYNRIKGEMQDQLKIIGFNTTLIFQPSILTGLRKEFRMGERIAQVVTKIFRPLMFGPMKKYKPIEGMVVAFAMHHKASQELNGYRIFESNEIQSAFDTRTK